MGPSHRSNGTPTIGNIESKSTGTVKTRATQNLRVMSRSSESSSSASGWIDLGSDAMPHLGHAPGLSLCTSGCIGQTYVSALSVPPAGCGSTG